MTPYKLNFLPIALKEWKKLDSSIQQEFKSKLKERLNHPEVISARLSGYDNVYKIKLCSCGYRLAYQVDNNKLVIIVIAVGKREKNKIYSKIKKRL